MSNRPCIPCMGLIKRLYSSYYSQAFWMAGVLEKKALNKETPIKYLDNPVFLNLDWTS